jgi:hypothetical protein
MNTARQFLLACLILSAAVKGADVPTIERIKPDRFGIIFNKGYAGDNLPSDLADFEKLIIAIKKAGFNVVLCKYDAKRLEICAKHDVEMFVDLLVEEYHVFKNPAKAQEVCESIKDSKAVYGYHLWSDNISNTHVGRTRDVQNVHQWDPRHATYVGSYKMSGVASVQDMDLFGYYDFHFKRGGHWRHLNHAWGVAKSRGIGFLRYDDASPGLVGKGNPNRVGYSIATSIVFGLRGYMFHYVRGQIDFQSFELDALGKDLARVNERFAAVGPELVKIGIPGAVYSTAITKTEKNDPVELNVPGGIAPVPADCWFQISSGEVLVGESLDSSKRTVLVFACHNPYENQKVVVAFPKGIKGAEIFDRTLKQWRPLVMENGAVSFTVEDFGVELLRVQR